MIIITGATGFIGSAMVWELNRRGIRDIVCVDFVLPTQRLGLLTGSQYSQFLLPEQLWSFLETPEAKSKVQWIIHMGACSSTTETNVQYLYEVNTLFTEKIFNWCVVENKHLIYASSAATYGAGELGFSDETDSEQLRPLNPYGDSKVHFDRWILRQSPNFSKNIHWYGLKFFNVFGPNENYKMGMSSVAFKAFHQIQKTGRLGLFKSYNSAYADGKQLRDFIYIKDITNWMCELMKKTPRSGIYNMGFGKARSWLDLAFSVFGAMNKPVQIDWLEMPDNIKNQYQYFTEANMEKWLKAGMSKPSWPLERAVDDYVKNYLQTGQFLSNPKE
jgi:ADP-L-glycero-D-manno-heptose 6-epimerase